MPAITSSLQRYSAISACIERSSHVFPIKSLEMRDAEFKPESEFSVFPVGSYDGRHGVAYDEVRKIRQNEIPCKVFDPRESRVRVSGQPDPPCKFVGRPELDPLVSRSVLSVPIPDRTFLVRERPPAIKDPGFVKPQTHSRKA